MAANSHGRACAWLAIGSSQFIRSLVRSFVRSFASLSMPWWDIFVLCRFSLFALFILFGICFLFIDDSLVRWFVVVEGQFGTWVAFLLMWVGGWRFGFGLLLLLVSVLNHHHHRCRRCECLLFSPSLFSKKKRKTRKKQEEAAVGGPHWPRMLVAFVTLVAIPPPPRFIYEAVLFFCLRSPSVLVAVVCRG